MRLAHTRASCASGRGRRGRGAGFPTADTDTAPPTPGHIPREFLILHAAVHDGPASHSLRTPDHRQVALREPQDHALPVPVRLRGRQSHREGDPGRRRARRRCRARRISRRDGRISAQHPYGSRNCWQCSRAKHLVWCLVGMGGSRLPVHSVRQNSL
ncbi:unnamed protein product [Ectocarpus sp. 8 AP-2014]